ncbi:MAG TPA: hypothetical protein DCX22_04850 [Dehalococcoidia bacterium]|nr:hypothetical protein [Dehalococcoidia bacterium]
MARKQKYNWDADAVRSLRKHLKKTQAELAEYLGMRQQTISEWEIGIHIPCGASVTMLTIVAERGNFSYQPSPGNITIGSVERK